MKRLLILLLALVTMTALPGQPGMLLVGDAAAPPPAQLLLDQYPGAAAAYSLRKLRAGYTGNCIQVRRSDTNALADIGFVNDYLDTVGLKAFCPVGVNCFVRTWYDQGINTRNAVMTTDLNQPQVVFSGSIFYSAGHPALYFDGINDHFTITNFYTATTTQSDICVMNRLISTNGVSVGGTTTASVISANVRSDNRAYFRNSTGVSGASILVTQSGFKLVATYYTSPNVSFYINNNLYSLSYTFTTSGTTINAIGRFGGIYNSADLYEIITWPVNQVSNRSSIEENINLFYTIY